MGDLADGWETRCADSDADGTVHQEEYLGRQIPYAASCILAIIQVVVATDSSYTGLIVVVVDILLFS